MTAAPVEAASNYFPNDQAQSMALLGNSVCLSQNPACAVLEQGRFVAQVPGTIEKNGILCVAGLIQAKLGTFG